MVRNMNESPVASVVGANCRRLRESAGVTQNGLAKNARDVGLRWTASKVRDFESGRNAPTFATVLAAAVALTHATGRNVSLAELVRDDGFVVLTDSLKVRGDKLASVLDGQAWDLRAGDVGLKVDPELIARAFANVAADSARFPQLGDVPAAEVFALNSRAGLDEERMAKRLGVSAYVLAAASAQLWRATASEERDRRVGGGANAQRRGHATRAIEQELRGFLDGNR